MKKLLTLILAAALVLSIGAAAYAETAPRGAAFVDADNDGVCDNCAYGDADGDGICDGCPNGGVRPMDGTGRRAGRCAGQGAGFVDADGDGVCDNRGNGRGCGRQLCK